MSLTLIAAIRRNKPKRNVNFIAASGADTFALALQKNGRVWAWGRNLRGNLGDNSLVDKYTPVSVLGTVKTFCQISNGQRHSLAIDKNGRAWGWGYNNLGQLGDNTTTNRLTPVSVLGAVKTFCQISTGVFHSLVIDKNGRVWAWGSNGNGQLGDNSVTQRLTPVSILGAVKTFCKIEVGESHSGAIDKNGRAWAWGYNGFGELGDNSVTQRLTPVSIAGTAKTFCQISTGTYYSLAIDKNGRAWGWGRNGYGRIGDNTLTSRLTPVSVLGAVKTFCQISAGQRHSLAIDKNGRAWGWGYNLFAHLGDNSITSRLTPVSIAGAVKTFCNINAGNTHSVAIDKNGRVWAWGSVINGALGNNAPEFRATPTSVLGAVKTFCIISGGFAHSLAIDKNGRAWGWGNNGGGEVGVNSTTSALTPVSVLGAVKTFCQISAGSNHSLAIDKNGRAWGWGRNGYGRIGDNTQTSRLTPVSVLGAVKTFCQISAGNGHSLAIDKNGRAWGWGRGYNGQIGNNSTPNRFTPVSVLGAVKTFCLIIAGSAHSLAIDKNGRAWGWGLNFAGQVGNNTTNGFSTGVLTPVSVLGAVKTFCQITASNNCSLAIDKNGRAWAWGDNGYGQLGDNSVTNRLTPVSVLGAVKTFCQISGSGGSGAHCLAIDKNGRAWAWGRNAFGELGIGSNTSQRTPVSVLGAVKTFCQIKAGGTHSLAIDKNGRAWAWGELGSGRLGINKEAFERTPVQVCNI